MAPDSARIFCDLALAARIERAECGLLEGGARAAARRDPTLEVLARPLAGGLAVWAGEGSPLCKVAGLGFAGPLDERELGAIERAFAARRAPVQVELATLAEPSVGESLTRRGYRLVGFENVLGRPLAPGAPEATPAGGVEIALSGAQELPVWLDAVVGGFAVPDEQGVAAHEEFARETIERVMGDLAATAGFVRYLARRQGEPAGGASMRLSDGVAQLCGAATLPAHRRRGVQSSLLAARLAAAAAAGCDLAVVTTAPGSKSQQNVARSGFELLYARAILVRDPRRGSERRRPVVGNAHQHREPAGAEGAAAGHLGGDRDLALPDFERPRAQAERLADRGGRQEVDLEPGGDEARQRPIVRRARLVAGGGLLESTRGGRGRAGRVAVDRCGDQPAVDDAGQRRLLRARHHRRDRLVSLPEAADPQAGFVQPAAAVAVAPAVGVAILESEIRVGHRRGSLARSGAV